jgi:hypothetical protein
VYRCVVVTWLWLKDDCTIPQRPTVLRRLGRRHVAKRTRRERPPDDRLVAKVGLRAPVRPAMTCNSHFTHFHAPRYRLPFRAAKRFFMTAPSRSTAMRRARPLECTYRFVVSVER